jgi:hypothetical protein
MHHSVDPVRRSLRQMLEATRGLQGDAVLWHLQAQLLPWRLRVALRMHLLVTGNAYTAAWVLTRDLAGCRSWSEIEVAFSDYRSHPEVFRSAWSSLLLGSPSRRRAHRFYQRLRTEWRVRRVGLTAAGPDVPALRPAGATEAAG